MEILVDNFHIQAETHGITMINIVNFRMQCLRLPWISPKLQMMLLYIAEICFVYLFCYI